MARAERLRQSLEMHYRAFNRESVSPDPIEFPYAYRAKYDIEITAFLASNFAFGSMPQIMAVLGKLKTLLGNHPADLLRNTPPEVLREKCNGVAHRFYSPADICGLLLLLGDVYRHGGLEPLFSGAYKECGSVKEMLEAVSQMLIARLPQLGIPVTRGMRFMFPQPSNGSACKRMNLFLRWMVRDDDIDFGIWKRIPANALIIRVDTHIARIAARLKFTRRKNVSWAMAEEITDALKRFDAADPVKYDFALCHLGIRKLGF